MTRKLVYCLFGLSLTGYILVGYFIPRENFIQLITAYSSLFIFYFCLLRMKTEINLNEAVAAGILFRFVLLFCLPALSDDIYRFLWDGRLYQSGINPFDFKPSEIIAHSTDPYLQQLYPYLNSPDYYSVYPQLLQYFFHIAVEFGGNTVLGGAIILKCVIFLF